MGARAPRSFRPTVTLGVKGAKKQLHRLHAWEGQLLPEGAAEQEVFM